MLNYFKDVTVPNAVTARHAKVTRAILDIAL